MRALQLVDWQHDPELRETEVAEPRAGEVLLRVGGAGVCHSDLHLLYEFPPGLVPRDLPVTLGHENAGWVSSSIPRPTPGPLQSVRARTARSPRVRRRSPN